MESINLFEAQPKWERPRQKIQVNSGVTIAFSTKSNSWVSRYSFTPSCYMNVGSELLSNSQTVEAIWAQGEGLTTAYEYINPGYAKHDFFYEQYRGYFSSASWLPPSYLFNLNMIYRHDVNSEYNTFYDNDTYMSSVEVVANDNPSAVKHFKSLSLESNSSDWVGSVYTNEDRGSDAEQFGDLGVFEEREGNQYAAIPKSTISGVGNIQLIGKLPLEKVWREGYSPNHPFGWTLKARGFMPYKLNEETSTPIYPNGKAEWQGGFTEYHHWNYNDGEVISSVFNPSETWHIPLFGQPHSSFSTQGEVGVFFGKKMHSTTASGVLHTALPTEGVDFSGYGAGLHRIQDNVVVAAGLKPPNYMTAPLRITAYSSTGSETTLEGGVDVPPNSITLKLHRGLRKNAEGQYIANDPVVNMEQYELLKELHDAIVAEVEPYDILSPPPSHHYMPSCEEGDLNSDGEAVPYEDCGERPGITWVAGTYGGEYVDSETEETVVWDNPPYFEPYLGPPRKCFSAGCDYSENEIALAGWIGVYAMSDPRLNGETMKGPYAGIKLYLPKASEPIELFAINVDYEKTKLDGSLG